MSLINAKMDRIVSMSIGTLMREFLSSKKYKSAQGNLRTLIKVQVIYKECMRRAKDKYSTSSP